VLIEIERSEKWEMAKRGCDPRDRG